MSMDVEEIFEEYGSGVFIVVGVILLFLSILTMSKFGTLSSAMFFLTAVAFFLAGFAFKFEWFYAGIGSKEGIGTVLICASVMTLATAGVLLLFRQPTNFEVIKGVNPRDRGFAYRYYGHPGSPGWSAVIFDLVCIYGEISGILGLIGIILFIAGFVLKLKSA